MDTRICRIKLIHSILFFQFQKSIVFTLAVLVATSLASPLGETYFLTPQASTTSIRYVQPVTSFTTGSLLPAASVPVSQFVLPAATTQVVRAAPVVHYAAPTITRVTPITTIVRPLAVSSGLGGIFRQKK